MRPPQSLANAEDEAVKAWQKAFKLDHLSATRILRSGRSGAEVRLVEFSRPGGELKIGILKVARDQKDFEREYQGYLTAASSWLAPLVPDEPQHCPVDGKFCLLSSLALPSGLQRESQTLQTLVDAGLDVRARLVMRALAEFYGFRSADSPAKYKGAKNRSKSAKSNPIELKARTPFEHLRDIFSPWAARAAGFNWREWGFPASRDESYIDGRAIRVNPLWCAFHENAWNSDAMTLAVSVQHGDLNPRNIIVADKIAEGASCADVLRLIDFEKVRTTSIFLDICCLSLWLVFESSQGRSLLTVPDWDVLPDALVSRVLADEPDERIAGSFKLPLDLVADLIRDVRGRLAGKGRLADEKLVDYMLALTLAVSALARANYELRVLEIAREDPSRPVDPECLRRAVCLFRIASRAFEQCDGLKKHRRQTGDLALADLTGLSEAQQIPVVAALGGKFSDRTAERVAAAATGKHALAQLAVRRVAHRIRHDRAALRSIVQRLKRLLKAETVDMGRVRRLLALVDLADPHLLDRLTAREQLRVCLCMLQFQNHLGASPDDFVLFPRLRELRAQLADLEPRLCMEVDLDEFVSYTNVFAFAEGRARLDAHWPTPPDPRILGPDLVGQFYSTLGQSHAFLEEYAQADARFREAVNHFEALRAVEPKLRRDQVSRTNNYRAINLLNWRPDDAVPLVAKLVRGRFKAPLIEAGDRVAMKGPSTKDHPYVHHLYLRYAHARNDGRAYLEQHQSWQTGSDHPWELIGLYRGLLAHPHHSSLARSCFGKAVNCALGLERTVAVIGLVIATVAICCDALQADLADQATGRILRESRRGGIAFDFTPLLDACSNPALDRVDGLLQLLPFNFR